MFNSGDYVLYNYNVCKIRKVETIHDHEYYVMSPVEDDSLVVKVPLVSQDKLLKHIMSKEESLSLIEKIPDIEEITVQDHALENEYKHLMTTGNREDLVKIIKTTYTRNKFRKDNGKKAGEKDSNYFNLAEKALYNEIGVSLGMSFNETKEYIINSLNR